MTSANKQQRYCNWEKIHPPATEELARALADEATGAVMYTVAPGRFVCDACAQLHPTGCPDLRDQAFRWPDLPCIDESTLAIAGIMGSQDDRSA